MSKYIVLIVALSVCTPAAPEIPSRENAPRGKITPYKVQLTRVSLDAIQQSKELFENERAKRRRQALLVCSVVCAGWFAMRRLSHSSGTVADQSAAAPVQSPQTQTNPLSLKNLPKTFMMLTALGVLVPAIGAISKVGIEALWDIGAALGYGYDGPFAQEEEALQGLMLELREVLRRVRAAQTGREGGVVAPGRVDAYESDQGAYYSLGIVSIYEYMVWRFQNLMALMYLIAPERNHPALTREVEELITCVNQFADQLEFDANNRNDGVARYSATTVKMAYGLIERVKHFIPRFLLKLKY